MAVSLFALISWSIIIIYYLIPKSLGRKENILMFFCLSILIVNISTVIEFNLKLIIINQEGSMYLPYWLYRSVITPFILIIFVNIYYSNQKKLPRAGIAALTAAGIIAVERMAILLEVIKYSGWNLYYSMITIILLTILTLLSKKLLDRISGGN